MSTVTKAIRHFYRLADSFAYERFYAGRKMESVPGKQGVAIRDLAAQPTLIVVAHPDDETIGTGLLLTRLPSASVVIVTDGVPSDGLAARAAGFRDNRSYRLARSRETAEALSLTGRSDIPVVHLNISDQRAIYHIKGIVLRLMPLMRATPFKYVITHPYEGGHPDHDATALAVHAACHLLRREGFDAPTPVEMTSYHWLGGKMVYGSFLPGTGAGPVETFLLTEGERELKQRMFDCHRTQREILKDFSVDAERFRAAPSYNFLAPPHAGPLGYESFLWRIDGASWRRTAARALDSLGLLEPR